MKFTSTFALSALLAATAVAQPHKPRYQDDAYNLEQRDDAADGVVWVTQTAFVTEEVGITTTIWVPAGAAATPETTPTSAAAASSAAPFSAAPSSSSAAAAAPAEFFGRPAAAAVGPPAVPTTFSSVYVAPAAPASSVAPSSAPAAAPVVVPSAPAEVAPVVPASSSAAAPVVPATSAAAPAVSSSSSSGSGSGSSGGSAFQDCTGTSSCKGAGYATFYDTPGADGSCGTSVDGTKTPVVAMSTDIMKALNGANPNTNPLCGASLKIVNTANGKTVTAAVYDTCMGCHDGHIDLSHAAWDALADHGASSEGSGTLPVTWSI